MKRLSPGKWILILAVLAISNSLSFAQVQCDIKAQLVGSADGMQAFLLKDLNVTSPEQNPILFSLTIQNLAATSKNYRISMQVRKLDSPYQGDFFSSDVKTDPFSMNGLETITLTNRQFGSAATRFKVSSAPTLNQVVKDLVSKTLGAGRLVSGRYQFELKMIEEANPINSSQDNFTIDVSNPSNLELTSPGEPAGSFEIPEIATDAPLLQWRSDARSFKVKVVDRKCTNSSPEEALNNTPYLFIQIDNAQSFPYPKDAVIPGGGGIRELSPTRPLEKGKTYYWTVRAVVSTSGGDVELPSAIYAFRVSGGMEDPNTRPIKDALEVVLGNQTRDLVQLLDCYRPSGQIKINGQNATLDDLRALGAKFSGGQLKIKSVSVE